MLVTAQAAYVYPRLAELAELRGDHAFAAQAAATAAARCADADARVVDARLVRARLLGGRSRSACGAIFGEPQPWAMLAGAPTPSRRRKLVGNIRRFLTGIGAPGGPAPDRLVAVARRPTIPDATETRRSAATGRRRQQRRLRRRRVVRGQRLADLGARRASTASSRTRASTPSTSSSATRSPRTPRSTRRTGTASSPSTTPAAPGTRPTRRSCGVGLSSQLHRRRSCTSRRGRCSTRSSSPASSRPPRLPDRSAPADEALLAATAPRRRRSDPPPLRGYVRATPGMLRMRVSRPAGRRLVVYSRGRRVRFARAGDFVVFDLPVRAGRAANWAVVASR